MSLSLKCQYAVRALFELAKRDSEGMVRLKEIAGAQHIPHRFLENILNELRQAGFVVSKRGKDGGFRLGRRAEDISVGDVVRFVEDSIHPSSCVVDQNCPLIGKCIFIELWNEAKNAIEKVYNGKSIKDLVDDEASRHAYGCHAPILAPGVAPDQAVILSAMPMEVSERHESV